MIGGKNEVEHWPELVIVPGTKPTHPTPQIYRSHFTVGLLNVTKGCVNYSIDFYFLEI